MSLHNAKWAIAGVQDLRKVPGHRPIVVNPENRVHSTLAIETIAVVYDVVAGGQLQRDG